MGVRTSAGAELLAGVTWTVGLGETWAVLGPNGAGKSTLLAVIGALRLPTSGAVTVLGQRFGRVDLREVRARIGRVGPPVAAAGGAAGDPADALSVLDAVLTGVTGTVRLRPSVLTAAEAERAGDLLSRLGVAALAGRAWGSCSQGERQRVRLARALVSRPGLLLLDEPATGLDLPAREAFLHALPDLCAETPTVLVTHHLEELPAATTHALLLAHGRVVAAGPVAEVLIDTALSECFAFPVRVSRADTGRWSAVAAPGWQPSREP